MRLVTGRDAFSWYAIPKQATKVCRSVSNCIEKPVSFLKCSGFEASRLRSDLHPALRDTGYQVIDSSSKKMLESESS